MLINIPEYFNNPLNQAYKKIQSCKLATKSVEVQVNRTAGSADMEDFTVKCSALPKYQH